MTTLQKMRATEYTILVAKLHYNTSLIMQKKHWLNILRFINNNFKAKCDTFFLRILGATGLGRNRWNLIILQSFKICTKLMFWKHKFSPNLEILYFYTEIVFWIHEFNAKIWNNFVFLHWNRMLNTWVQGKNLKKFCVLQWNCVSEAQL